jgi:hypothetical protein
MVRELLRGNTPVEGLELTDENRSHLLEAGVPQAVVSLLEGYAESVPTPPFSAPLPLEIQQLKVVKTSIGVLINASLGYGERSLPIARHQHSAFVDPVKERLNSLEAAKTVLKLSLAIYPAFSWDSNVSEPDVAESWQIRSEISNWSWRLLSELRDVKDESMHRDEFLAHGR